MPADKRRQDDQWHLGKTVDAGHLLTTIILVVGAILFFTDLDKRISIVESKDKDRDKAFQEFRTDIKEIKQLLWDLKSPPN